MKVFSQFSYDPSSIEYEVNSGELVTVPDQSLTVREILERYTSGVNPEMFEYEDEGLFDPNNEFEMDPTEDRDFDLSDYQFYKDYYERQTSSASIETGEIAEESTQSVESTSGESSGDKKD